MTSTLIPKQSSIQYSSRTIKRAERALCCSPFRLTLLARMQTQSVPLLSMIGQDGFKQSYTLKPISEQRGESALIWLISVGLLRREVDGQGITDSFRLTPLGRQLVEKWQQQGELPKPSWSDRFFNAVSRWLRLPF